MPRAFADMVGGAGDGERDGVGDDWDDEHDDAQGESSAGCSVSSIGWLVASPFAIFTLLTRLFFFFTALLAKLLATLSATSSIASSFSCFGTPVYHVLNFV